MKKEKTKMNIEKFDPKKLTKGAKETASVIAEIPATYLSDETLAIIKDNLLSHGFDEHPTPDLMKATLFVNALCTHIPKETHKGSLTIDKCEDFFVDFRDYDHNSNENIPEDLNALISYLEKKGFTGVFLVSEDIAYPVKKTFPDLA